MKRTYAPHEERKGPAAGPGRDPPHQTPGSEQQLPERTSGALLSQLPVAPAARSLRQTAVRQMQQTHGNAHVQRELFSEINRQPEDEEQAPATEAEAPVPEAEAPVAEAEAPGTEAGQAPTTISGDGSTVSADASGVTIDGARLSVNAGMVNINSAMVNTTGVLRTSTLVSDSVIASTYTPGVGNVQ